MNTTYREPIRRIGRFLVPALTVLSLAACNVTSDLGSSGSGGSGSDSETETTETTDAFPSELAVASPFSVEETSDLDSNLIRALASPSAAYTKTYDASTAEINAILSGATPADCTFNPESFLRQDVDAACYGPFVAYEEHPEGSAGNSGVLPPGDLGLWSETDLPTALPCAAAQYNARMDAVSGKSTASLTGLASMVCVINANGYSMPSSSTLDLTADMNALGLMGLTFANAELSHEVDGSGNDEYSYNMEFTYDDGFEDHDIVVDMIHTPTGTDSYEGQVSYLVNGTVPMSGNCPDPEITYNGSLRYARASADEIAVELRAASFCGVNSDGRDADGIVDSSVKYPTSADGWGNNFTILTANYAPETLDGDYSFVWQAGPGDSNTRVLNVHIATEETEDDEDAEDDDSDDADDDDDDDDDDADDDDSDNDVEDESSLQIGEAFFGYGDEIVSTDGGITGFICNWVAPGNDHTVADYVQYQEVEFDAASNVFTSLEADIGYAPTTTCEYDGSGSFIYDTDADGDLADETHAAVANELLPAQDLDGDTVAETIAETIASYGFTLPSF